MDLQMEYHEIREFVRNVVGPMMEYEVGSVLPKKIILNIYLNWKQTNNRPLLVKNTGQLQMELTNQIKVLFPEATSIRQKFKGLRFKLEHADSLEMQDRINGSLANDINFKKNYIDPVDKLLEEHYPHFKDSDLVDQSQLNKILKTSEE